MFKNETNTVRYEVILICYNIDMRNVRLFLLGVKYWKRCDGLQGSQCTVILSCRRGTVLGREISGESGAVDTQMWHNTQILPR